MEIKMEKERIIEVIKSLTNDRLCRGCQKYGHNNISCDLCMHIVGGIVIKELKAKD